MGLFEPGKTRGSIAQMYPVPIPADAAGANRPGLQAPTKVLEKIPARGGVFGLRTQNSYPSPAD